MKKLSTLLFFMSLLGLIIQPEVDAQINIKDVVNIEEVKKLIDEKIGEEKPLSEEELTKALLEMKDEKIENLEGNLSKVIDTAALYVGGIAVALAIIGWIFKKSIDEKLTKIEEKETNIKDIEQRLNSKFEEMNGFYQKMKDFADDVDQTNEKLKDSQELINEIRDELGKIDGKVETIEDIINSTVLVNNFIVNKVKATTITSHTKELFNRSPDYTLAEILKISDSLGMLSEIDSLEKLEEYFNHRPSGLIKEEEKLWEKYFHENLVAKEYEIRDEDTMTLSEEIEANYADWNYYLADIIKIHEFLSTKVNTKDE